MNRTYYNPAKCSKEVTVVASLRFTFENDRRPGTNCGERGRPPFYPLFPRYPQRRPCGVFSPLSGETPLPAADSAERKGPDDIRFSENQEQEVWEKGSPDQLSGGEALLDKALDNKDGKTGEYTTPPEQETEKDIGTVNVSDKFIYTMGVAETGLKSLKAQWTSPKFL